MILQEQFENYGYHDLLVDGVANEYKIDLETIFDNNEKPEELINIFISEQKDELFFVLNGNSMDINHLCDCWDNRIRIFTLINGNSNMIQRLKYNIVQLIICSKVITESDKSVEGNLLISRKIIVKGDITDINTIKINESEAIGLPFYMIPTETVKTDDEKLMLLKKLLPTDNDLLTLLKKKQKIDYKDKNANWNKSFEPENYNRIKRWLEE